MLEAAIGVGVVVLFLRMARMDEENQFLWSFLAAVAWFGPAWFMGPIAPFACTGLLFGVYFLWRMVKPTRGGQVR